MRGQLVEEGQGIRIVLLGEREAGEVRGGHDVDLLGAREVLCNVAARVREEEKDERGEPDAAITAAAASSPSSALTTAAARKATPKANRRPLMTAAIQNDQRSWELELISTRSTFAPMSPCGGIAAARAAPSRPSVAVGAGSVELGGLGFELVGGSWTSTALAGR